jgi:hypothetical protein
MNIIANFAIEPLLPINVGRDGGVSTLGDATATACIAIGQMRPMLDDIEDTTVGTDYALSKRVGHGYASFSGAWSELMMGR